MIPDEVVPYSTIPIKIILIVLLVIVLRAFLIQKSLMVVKRLVAFFMFSLLLILVLFPDISTYVAKKIGVGRGVDLIFYFSHLFLLLLIVALWRHSTVLMTTIAKLSRAIALQNPKRPGDNQKQSSQKPSV